MIGVVTVLTEQDDVFATISTTAFGANVMPVFALHFGLLVETDVLFSGGVVGFGFGSRVKVLLLEVITQMLKPLDPLFQGLDFQLLEQILVLAHLQQDCKVTQS
jgi:hypothetical protein